MAHRTPRERRGSGDGQRCSENMCWDQLGSVMLAPKKWDFIQEK